METTRTEGNKSDQEVAIYLDSYGKSDSISKGYVLYVLVLLGDFKSGVGR